VISIAPKKQKAKNKKQKKHTAHFSTKIFIKTLNISSSRAGVINIV